MKKSKFLNLSFLSFALVGGAIFTSTKIIDNSESTLQQADTFGIFGNNDEKIANTGLVKFIELEDTFGGAVLSDANGDDHLYMWGDNSFGQLGIPRDGNYNEPVETPLPIEGEVKDFSLGSSNSAMIITDTEGIDHLYTWGSSYQGALGNSDVVMPEYPGDAGDFNWRITENDVEENVINDVEVGDRYMGVVTENEHNQQVFYTWGNNASQQLGFHYEGLNYSNTPIVSPIINSIILLQKHETIVEYEASLDNSGIVTIDQNGQNHVYMWGNDEKGELSQMGINDYGSSYIKSGPLGVSEIVLPINTNVKDLSVGTSNTSLVITDELGIDHLYLWGSNSYGQLPNVYGPGDAEISTDKNTLDTLGKNAEVKLDGIEEIEKVSIGGSFYTSVGVIGLDSEGKSHLYMWGDNTNGQIVGTSDTVVKKPFEIILTDDSGEPMIGEIIDIETTRYGSMITFEDEIGNQHVYSWGDNSTSTLGQPENIKYGNPTEINFDIMNYSTITTMGEVEGNLFTFTIDSSVAVKEKLLIYNQNDEIVGFAVKDNAKASSTYIGTIALNTNGEKTSLYWSTGVGKTKNLISNDTYTFENIDYSVIIDNIKGILSSINIDTPVTLIPIIKSSGLEEIILRLVNANVDKPIEWVSVIQESPKFQEIVDSIEDIIAPPAETGDSTSLTPWLITASVIAFVLLIIVIALVIILIESKHKDNNNLESKLNESKA